MKEDDINEAAFEGFCDLIEPIHHIEAFGTNYPVKQGTFAGHDNWDMELNAMRDVRLLFVSGIGFTEELRGDEEATIVRENGNREKTTARRAWGELLIYQECTKQKWKNVERSE